MSDAQPSQVPLHVAIIMDGNGRWARHRNRPRLFGHRAGQNVAEEVIRAARERGVKFLTLFAFSSENWKRPEDEVDNLMGLLANALEKQVSRLSEGGIRLRFIGDLSRFSAGLRNAMRDAEKATADHDGMVLNVAVGYGGRWDILQAVQQLANEVQAGQLDADGITEAMLVQHMGLGDTPDPELLIRTGGEHRISNFLLWNLAYTELYFTETLWPDFTVAELDQAIDWFAGRDRRFGDINEKPTGEAGNA